MLIFSRRRILPLATLPVPDVGCRALVGEELRLFCTVGEVAERT